MRVAIADDDPIVCSSLSTILEATGTADVAWTANTGTDAVTQYEMDAPDVLLVDVQMPGAGGLYGGEYMLVMRGITGSRGSAPDQLRRRPAPVARSDPAGSARGPSR